MGTSYRIKVVQNNKSSYTTPDMASGMGATVIPAERGPMKPTKFNKGESERIRQLFGASRFETLEAIAYNSKYPLWISAPSSTGVTSAVLITKDGLKPVGLSLDGGEEPVDFTNLMLQYLAGKADGKNLQFRVEIPSYCLPGLEKSYIPQAYIVVGNEVKEVTLNWNNEKHGFDVTSDVGSGEGVLNDDNGGTITISFTFTTAPAKNAKVYFRLSTDTNQLSSDVYGIIGMRFPCKDFLTVSVYKSEKGNPEINLTKAGRSVTGYPIETSFEKGKQDATGKLIYCGELFKDDDYIFVKENPNFDFENGTFDLPDAKDAKVESFKYGDRGVECDSKLLVAGWEQFADFKKYPADIYFDVTGEKDVTVELVNLRNVIPYRRFLYPCGVNQKAKDVEKPAVDNRGICAFWGSAYILNPYEPTGNLLSTLMGEVAAKYADARVFSYGGRAVAWGDENQVGGQLNQGRIVEFLYNATEDEMKELDKKGVNPIVLNELFGPMVASRRTTDSSGSDYSYADYSMIIDYCIERIVNEVLPYQLIKFNDDTHRGIVRSKAEGILSPLLVKPNNVIRDFAIKCDAENNGDDVLSQQLFVLSVAIKVTPKSEYIQFNFINSAQGGSVEEDVA